MKKNYIFEKYFWLTLYKCIILWYIIIYTICIYNTYSFSKTIYNTLPTSSYVFFNVNLAPTTLTLDMIFWDFAKFRHRLCFPQLKQNLIWSTKNFVYELYDDLPNDFLRFRILAYKESKSRNLPSRNKAVVIAVKTYTK